MTRKIAARTAAIALTLCLAAAQSMIANVYPVSEESVREAYFFGQSTDRAKVAGFLGQYSRRLPCPNKGPCATEVTLHTPYEQVVRRSSENSVGYSAQQAQQDHAAAHDLLVVDVLVAPAVTAPGFVPTLSYDRGQAVDSRENFWRDFQFRVVQQNAIEPKNIKGKALYSRRGRGFSGTEIVLEFDAAQFEARTVQVEVTTPDGQTVRAEFDLEKLK
jgi:hypothetical protein